MALLFKLVPADLNITEIGMDIADIAVESKLCKTKSEARRMIEQGSLKLEGRAIADKFARMAWTGEDWIVLEHEQ